MQTDPTHMPSDFREVYQQFEDTSSESQQIATEYKELYLSAIATHEDTVKSIKNTYQKDVKNRDTTIKVLIVALLIVTGCAIYLAVKALECKKL